MKYKDRTHAKRKYKQALFVTVATMTLGVSTLGSTATAFADEKTANVQQQQADTSPSTGPVFKKETDGTFTVLRKNIFNMETLKAIGSLGGAGLKQAYADSQVDGGNFNNTFRTLAMGSAALIPYGGVVISPLIGLLWSEDKTAEANHLKKLMESVSAQTHEQIANYDTAKLSQALKDLKEKVAEFENLIPIPGSGNFYSNDQVGDYENIQTSAKNLNNYFRTAISACQTEGYQESELPIYIVLATAHMNFMNYVIENEKLLHFKPSVLEAEFKKKKDRYIHGSHGVSAGIDTVGYIEYVNEFAKKDLDKTNQIARDIPKSVRYQQEASNQLDRDLRAQFVKLGTQGASQQLEKTLNKSINNMAFKQAAGINSEFTLNQNGRPLYYSLDGKLQTGWKEIGSSFTTRHELDSDDTQIPLSRGWLKNVVGLSYSWYYFSPTKTAEFEQGEMYVNTTQTINGKTYKFDKDGKCLNPDGGKISDPILSGTYKIVSKLDNNMVLNTSNHAAVLRGNNEAPWGNSWTFQYDKEKKAYLITNRQNDHPGILASDWGSKDHSFVFATSDTANKPEHYWTLERAEDDYFFIHNNALPDKVLDITGNSTANGTKINLFDKNGQNNQKFKLEKIN
ncbi:insecticidal delta-endotoxin Cry8Ea1 family protein [Bacillus cereus group sp. MYBK234-1]|uniref:insecticidal delta-endotoxin Cry8Ea1 family protein n=1 Tax=unclassified Bacillus cereus group TaxID=2750818 RepID=UPI003F790AFA